MTLLPSRKLSAAFVGVFLIGALVGAPAPVPYLLAGLAVPATYLAGTAAVAAAFARDVPPRVRVRIPLVLAAMHMCWGAGYLTSPRRLVGRHVTPAAGRR